MLISLENFDKSKSREKIPLECFHCKSIFYIQKNYIQCALKGKSNSCGKLCSIKCRTAFFDKRLEVKCDQCGKIFKKRKSQVKKYNHNFCSPHCSGIYSAAHKIYGCNRSKLEKWLQTQLTNLYPNLEIFYNSTSAIGIELDIYIPKLNLAFELNGIFHYEPIFGKEKLEKTKKNDERKLLICEEKKINLYVINTSSQKYFKETTSQKFLTKIKELIDSKKLLF